MGHVQAYIQREAPQRASSGRFAMIWLCGCTQGSGALRDMLGRAPTRLPLIRFKVQARTGESGAERRHRESEQWYALDA